MGKINSEAIYLIQKGNAYKAFEKRVFTVSLPKENEVIIEVEAFGLNYADVMARNGLYREAPPMPCIRASCANPTAHVSGRVRGGYLRRRKRSLRVESTGGFRLYVNGCQCILLAWHNCSIAVRPSVKRSGFSKLIRVISYPERLKPTK